MKLITMPTLALLLGGCLETPAVQCTDGRLCPAGRACDNVHGGCVLPEQIAQCTNQPDGTDCSFQGEPNGACFDGVCFPAGCGNGEVEDGEACDDGNRLHGDGCSADCRSNETCGNGVVDFLTENCDDGNNIDGDGCQANCISPTCGDGVLDREFNEQCDEGASNSQAPDAPCRTNCLLPRCGDEVLDSGEICDDGNITSSDGCSFDCLSDETCGNDILDSAAGELCDDGNNDDGDGCQADCITPSCGDGIVDAAFNEGCDCGQDPFNLPAGCLTINANSPDASCRLNCQPQTCGDTITDPDAGEECDDGNFFPGDGCTGGCIVEICGNAIVDLKKVDGSFLPSEECDDGENPLNHDGCVIECRREDPVWTGPPPAVPVNEPPTVYDAARGVVVLFGGDSETWEYDGQSQTWTRVAQASPDAPSPRRDHAMAYDAARGVVVLFGGRDNVNFSGETWEYDGRTQTWTLVVPPGPGAPSQRHSHAMSYDAARGVVVLFGGFGGGANSNAGDETWEYDGATRTWTQISAAGPPARTRHAMAYDAARGKTMLFGGSRSGTGDNETWEYDGQSQTWTEVAQASPQTPLPREAPAIVYDGARGRLVLFGGRDTSALSGAGHFGDTWEYNGQTQTWTQRPFVSPDAPSARFLHGMAYDSERRVVVLFGGSDSSGLNDETWQYNGRGWIQVAQPSPAAPSPRQDHAMAYDTARDVVVLFGGRDSAGDDGETWEYDVADRRWTQVVITSATAPAPRRDHALAYDAASGKVVLFGGVAGSGSGVTNGETWEYDGRARSWTQVPVTSPDAPLPRRGHAMAADSGRGKVVLFGGVDSNGLDDETWEYDGQTQTWNQISVFPRPTRRQEHAMAFDAARSRVVLFGGNRSFGTLDGETWEYDGAARAWTRVLEASPDSPSPRRRLAMAYDAAREKVILFGGSDSNGSDGESWEYDGRAWIQLPVGSPDAPSARSGHAVAYGSTRSEVVLFGGVDSSENGETWTFQHTAGIADSCTTGFDGDADGLVGCDDPDCWGRCTPHCPVSSTPDWPTDCDTAEPHCGDGVCNAFLETRRLCPGDCGSPAPVCGDFHCDDAEDAASCPGDCTP